MGEGGAHLNSELQEFRCAPPSPCPKIPTLSEPPSDVVFSLPLGRRGEDLLGLIELHKLSVEKKSGLIGDSCCLLHVVGHNDDRVILLEVVDELFDFRRR